MIIKESIPIRENGEKFIALSQISETIAIKPHYFLNGIPGSINECYVRESAANRLLQATNYLPSHHFLVIFDAWRPYEVQKELYQRLKEKLQSNGLKGRELENELSSYVNKPSKDLSEPSNHLTGGALDLTIATEKGLLNMGTEFDDFSKKSRMDAYETLPELNKQERLIRDNRRLLKEIMENAGFSNYKEEWWHYDYGNQNWAVSNGHRSAFYSGVLTLENNIKL